MSRSNTVIVVNKELSEEQAKSLEEILNSPNFLNTMKEQYKDILNDLFGDGSKVESVEIKLIP